MKSIVLLSELNGENISILLCLTIRNQNYHFYKNQNCKATKTEKSRHDRIFITMQLIKSYCYFSPWYLRNHP